MKRSEMIELIRQNLDSGYISEASGLLDIIEKAGMISNTIQYNDCEEVVRLEDTDIQRDNGDFIFVWEPEENE